MDKAFWAQLDKLVSTEIPKNELDRILIKIRTAKAFGEQGLLNTALNLATYELLGDANMINEENEKYQSITSSQLHQQAKNILRRTNCSLLKVSANDK